MDLQTISAIIIDDEPDAINLLEMYLRHFPQINVTGKETDAQKGLDLVMDTLPELVFLDVDMPGMNGLQVANKIHSENFYSEIIFTTAHQRYAYDALRIEPLDFLTKPFCIDDLEIAIQKFIAKAEKKQLKQKLDKFIHLQANTPKFKFPTVQGLLIVELKDIVILKSKANNCYLFLQDGTIEEITRNIYLIIESLNSPAFFQINRSTYINLNYLQRIDKKRLKCILAFNQTIHEEIFSRIYIRHFEKLNLYSNI